MRFVEWVKWFHTAYLEAQRSQINLYVIHTLFC